MTKEMPHRSAFTLPSAVVDAVTALEDELEAALDVLSEVMDEVSEDFLESDAGRAAKVWLERLEGLFDELGSVDFTPEFDD